MRIASLIIFFVIVIAPVHVLAHGAGASFEQTIGEYKIDVGYDPVEPRVGERLILDFNLQTQSDPDVDFDRVWVRVVDGTKTLYATGVGKSMFGATTLLLTLPSFEGPATVQVRFEKGTEKLVDTTFPLPVAAEKSAGLKEAHLLLTGGFFGAIIGGFIGWVAARKKYIHDQSVA